MNKWNAARAIRRANPAFYAIAGAGMALLLSGCDAESPDATGGANQPPMAINDAFTVAAASQNNTLDVLTNDTDPNRDALSLLSFPDTTANSGVLTRDDNGTPDDLTDDRILYTPNQAFRGDDTFDYTIDDGRGGTAVGTVTVTVVEQQAQAGACADKAARLAAGQGYCFFASFNTDHDGTLIEMTVYAPHPDDLKTLTENTTGTALGTDEKGFAPLLVHGHGFGGSMATDFEADAAHFVDYQTARDAWHNGYFVISFSERGFGMSGGQIAFMDPTLEGQDHQELLDWAIKFLRGESSPGAGDGLYDNDWDETNPEHTSSTPAATADARPSLLQNDNLTRLLPDLKSACRSMDSEDCDPAVGTLGYSYGGGWQYTAAYADTADISAREEQQRWDALIPEGTWHDLRYSLSANDVPKGYWATLLFSFAVEGGTLSNGQPTPAFLVQVYTEAVLNGRVSAANQNFLGGNGTSFYCDPVNGVPVQASLLHIQGIRDTLFNFNDGYNNVRCFANAGNDARFLSVSGGHPYTLTQQAPYTGQRTSMDIDEIAHCKRPMDFDGDGDSGADDDASNNFQERLIVREQMLNWFEEKLRGQAGAADAIPVACITQHNTDPTDRLMDPNFFYEADAEFYYLKEGVSYDDIEDVLVGAGDAPTYSCDDGMTARCAINATVTLGGASEVSQATFLPLVTIDETRVMAGIPTVDLTISATTDVISPISGLPITIPATEAFIAIGTAIRRNGNTVILHDQLTAIRGTSEYPYQDTRGVVTENNNAVSYGCGIDEETLCERGRLAGISARLLPGDEVGLMFRSADTQYANIINLPGQATVTGDVEFPILAPSPLPESNN